MENNQPSSPTSGLSEDSLANMSSTLASIMQDAVNSSINMNNNIVYEANDDEASLDSSKVEDESCDTSIKSDISISDESVNDYGNIYVITSDKLPNNRKHKIIYSWESVSKRLKIPIDELKVSSIIRYLTRFKSWIEHYRQSIPLLIYNGSILKEDIKIVDLKTSPILLFKHVKFKDNSLSGINNSINHIMSNYFGGMNTNMTGNIFESLINNMTNIQNDLNNAENDNDSDDGIDIEDEDENVNQVNNNQNLNNQSLNIMNQLLNMYSNNTVTQTSITNTLKDKYKDEIETMKNMGLVDETLIIQSLSICEGNVEHAINYYFNSA